MPIFQASLQFTDMPKSCFSVFDKFGLPDLAFGTSPTKPPYLLPSFWSVLNKGVFWFPLHEILWLNILGSIKCRDISRLLLHFSRIFSLWFSFKVWKNGLALVDYIWKWLGQGKIVKLMKIWQYVDNENVDNIFRMAEPPLFVNYVGLPKPFYKNII